MLEEIPSIAKPVYYKWLWKTRVTSCTADAVDRV